MRVQFPNLVRPKQAAKHLVRAATTHKLSTVHEALARVLGYRDWHELSISARPNPSPLANEIGVEEALRVIFKLADALDLPDTDVQYAVSKARLLRKAHWSIDEQMTMHTSIWRRRVFGPPGRRKPGTIMMDKANGDNTPAYLRRAGRPTYLLFDTGLGERADFEVVKPRVSPSDFVPSCLWLPYGLWTLKDGTIVIFSRDYLPMWGISAGRVERLAPWLWINDIVSETHFAGSGGGGWASDKTRELAIGSLAQHRIFELPRLTDIMPHLFEVDVESVQDGVRRLYDTKISNHILPAYAGLNTRLVG